MRLIKLKREKKHQISPPLFLPFSQPFFTHGFRALTFPSRIFQKERNNLNRECTCARGFVIFSSCNLKNSVERVRRVFSFSFFPTPVLLSWFHMKGVKRRPNMRMVWLMDNVHVTGKKTTTRIGGRVCFAKDGW